MLSRLFIRNIVLTEELDLEFFPGLCVLTGETGAGKSVLLDSLNLALGKRAESRLVRKGAMDAEVIAEFELSPQHFIYDEFLADEIFEKGENIIFRRKISHDGRSKAWLNGKPVSAQLLKQVGSRLLEIHGQFDTQKLLDASIHKYYLDKYGHHEALLSRVKKAWQIWGEAQKNRKKALQDWEKQQSDEEFIRLSVEELQKLSPIEGEEQELTEKRSLMKSSQDLLSALSEAGQILENENGVLDYLRKTMRLMDRANEKTNGHFDELIDILEEAATKADEGLSKIQDYQQDFDFSPYALEEIEERLFALRSLARKHNIPIDMLASKQAELEEILSYLDNSSDYLKQLEALEEKARQDYIKAGHELTMMRQKTAAQLDEALNKELTPLHLEKARFQTLITPLDEEQWNSEGHENIEFQVSTHKGGAVGSIGKIASGGELARLTLALRIILAKVDDISTLVLDEADAGISGRIAEAMGERLSYLSQNLQILVVTHSPQIAAQGRHHWQVHKTEKQGSLQTSVQKLNQEQRIEAIAAMMAGKNISDEARAAAQILLQIKE